MRKKRKIWSLPRWGYLVALVIIVFSFKFIPSNKASESPLLPECYIAKAEGCVLGYNPVDMTGGSGGFIQCCRGEPYLLQGIDVDLLYHYLKDNRQVQSIFKSYNCSFDISRKLYCTDVDDCYKRPDLKGCSDLDCNKCCFNSCTLIGCGFVWNKNSSGET